jgi:peptide/nickel transport system substrate-binding protein
MKTFIRPLARFAFLAAFALTANAQAQQAANVLRVVPQADLKILDPIWTTAFVTRNHGYNVYDTLFGIDANNKVQPQMVDKYTVSKDQLTWKFSLREGLAFHDGQPVTSEDVIASLKRWAERDVLGQKMFAALGKIEAIDQNSFQLVFKEPFLFVIEALSKPTSVPPFIMPKRIAATPADKQISEFIGSGPYIFSKEEYRPGEKIVYLKNAKYVPRKEAPSGTAGGKNVYVDRMEWIILKDAQTQANALANGEVDFIEWLPPEQYAGFKNNPKITMQGVDGVFGLHLNHHIPPFNNPKIAQAALMAISQEAIMKAQIVHRELYGTCTSIYSCNSPYASTRTSFFTGAPQLDRAKALLKEAGYDGKPIVVMHPADFVVLNKLAPVYTQLLKRAGFNVDMQSVDWPTLVTRRAKKDSVANGGWNVFMTGWTPADNVNPMYFAPITGNGEKGYFGWPTDEALENLKAQFLATADDAKRKDIAAKIQERVYESGIYAPLGQYKLLSAYRNDVVSGVVKAPINVYWNIRRK